MGFGTEILFIVMLGFLFVGPKRLPTILGQIARAKTQLENATRNLGSKLEAELEPHVRTNTSPLIRKTTEGQ